MENLYLGKTNLVLCNQDTLDIVIVNKRYWELKTVVSKFQRKK